jgi:hypothetical protein
VAAEGYERTSEVIATPAEISYSITVGIMIWDLLKD